MINFFPETLWNSYIQISVVIQSNLQGHTLHPEVLPLLKTLLELPSEPVYEPKK